MDEKSKIEIRVGSKSDILKLKRTFEFLKSILIPYSFTGNQYQGGILSAHRTTETMMHEARSLEDNDYLVSIAAAGGSAHLPGMTASETLIPVVGIPVETNFLGGVDSLLSIIQMPEGVPLGCVGIGQAESAAILAAQIAYVNDPVIRNRIRKRRGIERELSLKLPNRNLVGIIGISESERKYGEFTNFLDALGLEREKYSGSNNVKETLEIWEEAGAKTVVVFGVYDEFDSTMGLPKTISQYTDLPIIGVPLIPKSYKIESGDLSMMLCDERDEEKQLSYPVAGMGTNRVKNAALYAARICGNFDSGIKDNLRKYNESQAVQVGEDNKTLSREGINAFL